MFEVWLQMSDTNIDRENPSDLPALVKRERESVYIENLSTRGGGSGGGIVNAKPKYPPDASSGYNNN